MTLNIKDALETVKRAGFGNDDIMHTGAPERRMIDGEFLTDQDPLEEIFARIEHHRNPQEMASEQLLDVEDL